MERQKVCDRFCKGCVYYDGWYESNRHCNYILIEGKPRECDPGKGCIRKLKRQRRRKSWRIKTDG